MATFKREWFNSETNYVKANYIVGNNPVRNWADIIDSEGKPSFNDTTSNFSKISLKNVKPATWATYFNSKIIDCTKIDFGNTNTSTYSYTFAQPTELHNVKLTEAPSSWQNMFSALYNLAYLEVTLPDSGNKNWLQCFRTNPQLRTLIIHNTQDCYNTEHKGWSTFSNLNSLTRFELWGWNQDLWISKELYSTENWTRNTFVSLFKSIATVTATKTITIGSDNLAKLTDEDKKIATDKGWTLA